MLDAVTAVNDTGKWIKEVITFVSGRDVSDEGVSYNLKQVDKHGVLVNKFSLL